MQQGPQLIKDIGPASAEHALSLVSTQSTSLPYPPASGRGRVTNSISPKCKNRPFPTIHVVTTTVTMFLNVATRPGHM